MKLAVVYILTGNPAIGILGVPIGTALCNLCIAILNLLSIRRCIPENPAIVKNLLRPVLPVAVMGAVAYFSWQGLMVLLGPDASRVILCGAPIAAAGVVYLVLTVLCKAFTREDCMLLPKGDKIARLLKL